jgi:hypothetical protein
MNMPTMGEVSIDESVLSLAHTKFALGQTHSSCW